MFKKYRIYQNVYIHTVEWKNSKKYILVCTSEIENVEKKMILINSIITFNL